MNFLCKRKDGGKDSPVDAYFLIEIKGLFSIALLKFNKGKREQFHTHAFNAYTWLLKGNLVEEVISDQGITKNTYETFKTKYTAKRKNHRVIAIEDSWCLTIRGKWDFNWTEYDVDKDITTVLTHGRKKLLTIKGLHY